MTTKALVVRRMDTREEVHRLDVSRKTESQVERILRGLLRQMDCDAYYVEEE